MLIVSDTLKKEEVEEVDDDDAERKTSVRYNIDGPDD